MLIDHAVTKFLIFKVIIIRIIIAPHIVLKELIEISTVCLTCLGAIIIQELDQSGVVSVNPFLVFPGQLTIFYLVHLFIHMSPYFKITLKTGDMFLKFSYILSANSA